MLLVVFSPKKLVNRDRYDFLSCASKSPLRSVTRKNTKPRMYGIEKQNQAKPDKRPPCDTDANSGFEMMQKTTNAHILESKQPPIFRGRDTAPGAFSVSKTANSEEVSIVFFHRAIRKCRIFVFRNKEPYVD